jgi:hypothetical protein
MVNRAHGYAGARVRSRWHVHGRPFAIAVVAALVCACSLPPTLTQQMDAEREAANLASSFARTTDAGNRAVMADADEAAAAAVQEAGEARQAVTQSIARLRTQLDSLQFGAEREHLDGFATAFEEYERLDADILALAVEHSNVKAQRLSFGAANEAAQALQAALAAAVEAAGAPDQVRAEVLALRARVSVLESVALFAPHIAESDEAIMTRMEKQMEASGASAKQALADLRPVVPPAATSHIDAAVAALDRFLSVESEIVALSRRNSDVHSLALTLGKKRTLIARCEDQLRALQGGLAMRGTSAATR